MSNLDVARSDLNWKIYWLFYCLDIPLRYIFSKTKLLFFNILPENPYFSTYLQNDLKNQHLHLIKLTIADDTAGILNWNERPKVASWCSRCSKKNYSCGSNSLATIIGNEMCNLHHKWFLCLESLLVNA